MGQGKDVAQCGHGVLESGTTSGSGARGRIWGQPGSSGFLLAALSRNRGFGSIGVASSGPGSSVLGARSGSNGSGAWGLGFASFGSWGLGWGASVVGRLEGWAGATPTEPTGLAGLTETTSYEHMRAHGSVLENRDPLRSDTAATENRFFFNLFRFFLCLTVAFKKRVAEIVVFRVRVFSCSCKTVKKYWVLGVFELPWGWSWCGGAKKKVAK